MKPKDVGFLSQHLEKLILVAGLVIACVIVMKFVLGEPYAAKVGPRDAGPGEAPKVVLDRAKMLHTKLNSDQSPIERTKVTQYSAVFRDRAERPPLQRLIAEGQGLAIALSRPGLGPEVGGGNEPKPTYFVPSVPLPEGMIASARYGVLGRVEDRSANQQLIQLVGNHEPRDFRYVSVLATFDMDKWVERLDNKQSAGELEPLPRRWWQPNLAVAGVYLQRQEQNPLTGQWGVFTDEGFREGQTQIIDALPTQTAYRDVSNRRWQQQEVEATLRLIKGGQEQVVRPEFPPLARGTWLPPDSKAGLLDAEGQRELRKVLDDIESLKKRIDLLQEQLERLRQQEALQAEREAARAAAGGGATARSTPTPRASPRGGASYDEMGGAPSSRTSRTSPRGNAGAAAGQTREQQMTEQLQRLQEDYVANLQLRAELLGLEQDIASRNPYGQQPYGGGYPGMDPEMGGAYGRPGMYGQPGMYGPGAGYYGGMDPEMGGYGAMPGAPAEEPAEEVSKQIKVWAHDLTVQPGRTYRYRVVVYVLNPLFRQSRVAVEQRAENEHKIAIGPSEEELAAAPWTDPVQVDPEYHFFLIGGNAASQEASIEAWRLYNGTWRKLEFGGLEPGDLIGGSGTVTDEKTGQMKLDMEIGALVVDVTPVSGSRGGAIQMYYLDPELGRLAARNSELDRDSELRQRLINEAAIFQELERGSEPQARAE
jgi:hypothetical protein